MGEHTEPQPRVGVVPGTRTLDDRTRRTYRYLRASIVALALLLSVSLVLEFLRFGEAVERFGSISGYYYSPVRSVFVGALVALGPALIALKGRPGWEDTLLDLAGMLIPVVALVPTPRRQLSGVCLDGSQTCISPDLMPAVRNNVTALIIVGLAVLVFAWWNTRRAQDDATRAGVRWAMGTWALFTVVFLVWDEWFFKVAHNAAAIPFFCLIALFAFLTGHRAPGRSVVPVLSPRWYSTIYRAVSALMLVTILVTLLYYGLGWLLGFATWDYTVFLVESVLLVLFVVFWSFQTAENWYSESVEDTSTA